MPSDPQPPSVPRRFAAALGLALLLALAGLALAVVAPLAFGCRPFTVLTGSMEPAISPGDVVAEQRISPLDAGVGDVVTFRDPEDQSRLITHRVQAVHRDGDALLFVTRGDANDASERWRIGVDGELGRVLYTVPLLGHVAILTRHRTGLLLLLAVPLLLLAFDELHRIWRPPSGRTVGDVV